MKGYVNKILMGMFKEASKTCRIDQEGSRYITVNKFVRGFTIVTSMTSILLFFLTPYYAKDSLNTAILLLVIGISNLFYSLKILLSRYSLTDKGLVCRSFLRKTIKYSKLEEIWKVKPPYMVCAQSGNYYELFVDSNIKVKISLLYFYGSYDFISQLERKTGIGAEQKNAEYKRRIDIIPFISLVFLGAALFMMKSSSSVQSESVQEETSSAPFVDFSHIEENTFQNENRDAEKEVAYFKEDENSHTILNTRFHYFVTIPKSWRAFDRSVNGDGYFIECDNPNVDIRVYGQYDLGEDFVYEGAHSMEYIFESGIVGWITTESERSITAAYRSEGRVIEMYIGFEGEEDWLTENLETVLRTAGSLWDAQ